MSNTENSNADLAAEAQALRARVAQLECENEQLRTRMVERERAGEALSSERTMLRTLIENLPHDIYVKDGQGHFLLVNESAARHLGGTCPAEVVGKTDADFFAPERAAQFLRQEQELIAQGLPILDRTCQTDWDGEKCWVMASKIPLRDEEGKVFGLLGITHDITERKLAEATLTEERNLLRVMVENLPSSFFVKDTEGRFAMVNQVAVAKMGKSTPEEVLGKTDADFFPPSRTEQWLAEEREIMQTGRPLLDREYCFVDELTGQKNWFQTSKIPFYDSQGKIRGLVGFNHNVTKQKTIENALAEERNLLRAIIDSIPDDIFVKDTEGRFLLINQAALDLVDKDSPEEVLGKTDFDFFPREQAEGFFAIEQEILRTGRPVINQEAFGHRRRTGEKRWSLNSKLPFYNEQGRIIGLIGIKHTITDRKLAENTLAQERAMWGTLIDNIPSDVYAKDLQGRFVLANDVVIRNMRCSSLEEVAGKTDLDFIPPKFAEQYFAEEQEIMRTGVPIIDKEEIFIDEASGEKLWFLSTKIPCRDSEGNVIGLVGINHNLTPRKLVEEALRQGEERYRILYENSPIPLWEWDLSEVRRLALELREAGHANLGAYLSAYPEEVRKGAALARVLDVNQTALDFFTAGAKDDFRQDMGRFFIQETYNGFREIMVALAEGRRTVECETSFLTQTGERKIVSLRLSMAPGHEATYANVLASLVDITERKWAENALAEERVLLRTIIESIPSDFFVKDTQSRFVFANNAAVTKLGRTTQEELIGKTDFDFFPPERAERYFAEEAEIFRSGQPIINQEQMIDNPQTGKKKWLLTTKIPYRDSEGRILGLVGINHYITERKEAEEAMLRASRMEATATLAGGIAHDFNNLMVGVLGYAELLELELAERAEARRMLARISQSARRAGELAQQMLAYARGGKYQARPMNLSDTIQEILQLQRRSFPPRIDIGLKVEPELWNIAADPVQMSQVMMNLCINAAEAIEGNGRIDIALRNVAVDEGFARMHTGLQPGAYVYLSVADTGCGMSRETIDKVFEPFFTTKFQGRGLGLAAVYGIIKNHGGYITVYSEEGHGSIFKVFLPATGLDLKESAKPAAAIPNGSETILIIDDEDIVLEVTQTILAYFGYRSLVAHNGREAIELLRAYEGRIDLALLDMGMPVMGGSETYTLLKAAQADLKVIVCSGYELDAAAQALLDMGANAFIQKPFRMDSIGLEIRKVLDAG